MDKTYWYYTVKYITRAFVTLEARSVIESNNNLFPLIEAEEKENALANDALKIRVTFAIEISEDDYETFNRNMNLKN